MRARACRRAKKNKIDRGSARIKRAIAAAERTVKRRRVQILAEAEVGRLLGGLRERGAHPLDLEERVVGGVARAQQYCALGVGEYAELQRQRRERVLYRGRHVNRASGARLFLPSDCPLKVTVTPRSIRL